MTLCVGSRQWAAQLSWVNLWVLNLATSGPALGVLELLTGLVRLGLLLAQTARSRASSFRTVSESSTVQARQARACSFYGCFRLSLLPHKPEGAHWVSGVRKLLGKLFPHLLLLSLIPVSLAYSSFSNLLPKPV